MAIIGISCIFAKSEDQKAFYHLISRGVDGITDPPESHSHLLDYFDPDAKKPRITFIARGADISLQPILIQPNSAFRPNILEATDTLSTAGVGDRQARFG